MYFIVVILILETRHEKGELSFAPSCRPPKSRHVARNLQWGRTVTGVWGQSPQRSKILYFFFGKKDLILF